MRVGLNEEYLRIGYEKGRKSLVCIYVCVCDGPALFLGCVAQSVPSSVSMPLFFCCSLVVSPFFRLSSLYKIHSKVRARNNTGNAGL